MHWQDWVFAIGTWVFVGALIPMIRSPHKPPLSSSIPSAVFLWVFAISYVSLGLWLAAGSTVVTALCWSVLAVQKYRQEHH